MTEEEKLRLVIRTTIAEVFEVMGVDISTVEGRKEFRDNLSWLSAFRTGTTNARTAATTVGVTTLVGAVLWLTWQGIKAAAKTMGVP